MLDLGWDPDYNRTGSHKAETLRQALLEHYVYPSQYVKENGYATLDITFRLVETSIT